MEAALEANAHMADDATSFGSSSPPLLSIPPFPEPLTVTAPPPLGGFPLNGSTTINPSAQASCMPTPLIGDLPTDDANPMAKLNRAISTHLAELNHQRLAIEAKYDAFHDLLVTVQTDFTVPALE
jgi:hypothetical protein